jgi:hypothetical protein
MLQTMNEQDAADVFSRIRGGGNAEAIVQHVQEGRLMMGLSTKSASSPDVTERYEFPYIGHIPTALRDNLYFRSEVYKAIQAYEKPSPTMHAPSASVLWQSNYTHPLLVAELVEPLLAEAKPSKWTRVSSNDSLLRKLIDAYLIYEYPWEFTFHKDYFLEDLMYGGNRFCSSLLMNALLAKACVSKLLPPML